MSYTRFEYKDLQLANELKAGEVAEVSVTITNTGDREGEEVVQLYVSQINSPVPAPLKSLKAFDRINLKPGESRTVQFTLPPETFRIINEDNEREIRSGIFEISIGGGQPGVLTGSSNVLTKRIELI